AQMGDTGQGPLQAGRGHAVERAFRDVISREFVERHALLIDGAWPPLGEIGDALAEEAHRIGPLRRAGALSVLAPTVRIPNPVDSPTLVDIAESSHVDLRCVRFVRMRPTPAAQRRCVTLAATWKYCSGSLWEQGVGG